MSQYLEALAKSWSVQKDAPIGRFQRLFKQTKTTTLLDKNPGKYSVHGYMSEIPSKQGSKGSR
jgi:hypothetical protein